MEKVVSAAEANRRFSEILRGAREGINYVVTSHGRPVARISPIGDEHKAGAREALFRRLKRQPAVNAGRWKRDELYED